MVDVACFTFGQTLPLHVGFVLGTLIARGWFDPECNQDALLRGDLVDDHWSRSP